LLTGWYNIEYKKSASEGTHADVATGATFNAAKPEESEWLRITKWLRNRIQLLG
jgi:hypothetical protein